MTTLSFVLYETKNITFSVLYALNEIQRKTKIKLFMLTKLKNNLIKPLTTNRETFKELLKTALTFLVLDKIKSE